MPNLRVIACSLLVCIAVVIPIADGQGISCQTVVSSLEPCLTYLTKGGSTVPAACCQGVSSLYSAASTSAERQAACTCIKAAAQSYGANPQYAAAIPSQCHVNIGYPISYSVNCSSVQ